MAAGQNNNPQREPRPMNDQNDPTATNKRGHEAGSVDLQRMGSCRECAGTGAWNENGSIPWRHPLWRKCWRCNGSGYEPPIEDGKAATVAVSDKSAPGGTR